MDDEGFAAYMAARWPALVRSLVMLGCDAHEAEDVVQTALIRCSSAWDRVSRADDTDAYVYRSVLNTWSKSRRRRWWGERPTQLLPESETADAAELAVARHDIERALGRLSDDHRTVLVLRFVADLSEHDVARVLRVPPGTVKSRTARALAQVELADLREELLADRTPSLLTRVPLHAVMARGAAHDLVVGFGVSGTDLGGSVFSEREEAMCRELSPGGRLACANPVCNGRSHVWVHESSAPDRKRDLDARDHNVGSLKLEAEPGC